MNCVVKVEFGKIIDLERIPDDLEKINNFKLFTDFNDSQN